MSDNQEEFDALRKAVYPFVNEHGKDADRLRCFCEDFMREWRATRGSRGADDRALINDVVRWTMNRYNRPRYQPKRSREQRAADVVMAPGALTIAGELYGRASIRNATLLLHQSKSTVGRHLVRQGIAPRRDAKIRKLAKSTQQLVRILDATFETKAAGILQLERLGTALWDVGKTRHVPPTTQAPRKKKLTALLAEISGAGVGYSIVTIGDVCGVFRGRRFRSLGEANTRIAEAQRLGRYPAIVQPEPIAVPAARDYFWADPFVRDVMAIIEMGVTGHFYPIEKLDAIYRFERLLTDMTPVLPWLERAHHSFAGDDIAENLSALAGKITDPVVRKATTRLATIMRDLKNFMGPWPTCFDAFQNVDMVLGVMDKTAEASPESFAKLAYIREWFATTGEDYLEARGRLSRMLELEKSGEWQAPDSETLSHYLPEVVQEVEVGDENDLPY